MTYRDSSTDGGRVRVKTSPVAGETIGPSGLRTGELALNSADGKLYYKTATGALGTVANGFDDAPEDGTTYGRKDADWVDITSPANLQVRRGTAAEVAAITPLAGEPVWATDTKVLTVGDGSTAGGVISGHPAKVWQGGGANMDGVPFSLFTLTPQNSVWELSVLLNLGPAGSDYETNEYTVISLASSSGIAAPIGHFIYINSTGNVQHKILSDTAATFDITGNGEFLRINAIVSVTSSSGVVTMSAANDNWSGGIAAESFAIAKRIA